MCWCSHPKKAHWEAGGCRVTGCGCQQFDDGASAVQELPEATVVKFEIPPGYRAKVELIPEVERDNTAG